MEDGCQIQHLEFTTYKGLSISLYMKDMRQMGTSFWEPDSWLDEPLAVERGEDDIIKEYSFNFTNILFVLIHYPH